MDRKNSDHIHLSAVDRRFKTCFLVAGMLISLFAPSWQVMAQQVLNPLRPTHTSSREVSRNNDGKLCVYEETTGSRMKRRVCNTPEKWLEREEAGKNLARDLDAKPKNDDSD